MDSGALTKFGEVVGTPYYRAPEVRDGEPATVRSEVYSLGRLLEWLVTGDVSKDRKHRRVPRENEADDSVCDRLDQIISRAANADPEQRYGSVNELVADLPALWLTVRTVDKPPPVKVAAPDVFDSALELARSGDLVGWRLLENSVRGQLHPKMSQWLEAIGPNVPSDSGDTALSDRLLDACSDRLKIGLAGVFSGKPAFASTGRVLEDFVDVPEWPRGGRVLLSTAPRSMAFVFSYLAMALWLSMDDHESAIVYALESHQDPESGHARAFWRHPFSNSHLLQGRGTASWNYLLHLWDAFPPLKILFGSERDFGAALTAASLLLAVIEVAHDSLTVKPEQLDHEFFLEASPMFLSSPDELLVRARGKTLANELVASAVAKSTGANRDAMTALWRGRSKQLAKMGTGLSPNGFRVFDASTLWPLGNQ